MPLRLFATFSRTRRGWYSVTCSFCPCQVDSRVNERVASESKRRRRRMFPHSRVISELLYLGQIEHWYISVDNSDVGLILAPTARQLGVFNGLAVSASVSVDDSFLVTLRRLPI